MVSIMSIIGVVVLKIPKIKRYIYMGATLLLVIPTDGYADRQTWLN